VVLPVAIVVAIVVAILFVGGNKVISVISGGDEAPPFDFKLGKAIGIPTKEGVRAPSLQAKADETARAALPTIDAFFTEAFLDPGNWKDGSYDSAFDGFDDEARHRAEAELGTLTLGSDAGKTYTTVTPGKGKVWFRVLFDPSGDPADVDAIVRFHALGKGKDGTYTDITAHGQFFLHDIGDGWKVYAFTLGRSDHETAPPAGPSAGTPSPSG
jgi:hypothetical protein